MNMKRFNITVAVILLSVAASADEYKGFRWIKDYDYEQVRHYSNGLSAFRQGGLWGYMDRNGEVVIQPMYDECRDFCGNLAAVKKDGKWGYVTSAGVPALANVYDEAGDFINGNAIIRQGDKWGVINRNGKAYAGIIFDEIEAYSDGFALASAGGVQFYIDASGRHQNLDEDYRYGCFSDGMAPIQDKKSGRWGYVSNKGYIEIPARYDTVYAFSNGVALVKEKDDYKYITKSEKTRKIDAATGQPLVFVNGFAKIKTYRGVGFINKDMKPLKITGRDATDFNENGIAAMEMEDGRLCYINTAGKEVFPADYDAVGAFSNGLAWVYSGGKYGFIDVNGHLVIKPVFDTVTDFRDSLAFVSLNNRFGAIKYAPGYSAPKISMGDYTLLDSNDNNKVDSNEKFTMSLMVVNESSEDLKNVEVRFANQEDQESWFKFDSRSVVIPELKARSQKEVTFSGESDMSILSDNVGLRFMATAANTCAVSEADWSFESVGIEACKPIISSYWVYNDNHTALQDGKANLRLSVRNDGQDPAKHVQIKLRWPEGIGADSEVLTIPYLEPGNSQDIEVAFRYPARSSDEYTVVANISDFTQLHNKTEYIQFVLGKMNSPVSLDSRVNPADYNFGYSGAAFAGVAPSASGIGASQDQEPAFVSELLKDIRKIARPDDRRYALIIGNEDYNSFRTRAVSQPDVEFAVADAEAFRAYALNYFGVPEDQILYIKNATKQQMLMEMDAFKKMCNGRGADAEVYVFYAGHGQHDEKSGATYLMPVDVQLSAPTHGIKLDDFYADISGCTASRRFVFMDACYSGLGRAMVFEVIEPVLKGNIIVMTATNSQQTAMPYKAKHHGVFTYHLLNSIKEAGGVISVESLYRKVKQKVTNTSLGVNKSVQTPEMNPGDGIESGWEKWELF